MSDITLFDLLLLPIVVIFDGVGHSHDRILAFRTAGLVLRFSGKIASDGTYFLYVVREPEWLSDTRGHHYWDALQNVFPSLQLNCFTHVTIEASDFAKMRLIW